MLSSRYPPYTATKVKLLALATHPIHVPWKRVFVVVLVAAVYARLRVTNPNFWQGVQAFFGLA